MKTQRFLAVVVGLLMATTIATSGAPAHAADAAAIPAGCRNAESRYQGAAIYGRICWGRHPLHIGTMRAWVNGTVTDQWGDGKYAMFRIHYRTNGGTHWQTHTAFVKTTKGHRAPVQLPVRSKKYNAWRIKDFWIQACVQGDGVRRCERTWH